MLDIQHAWQLALVHIDDQGLTNALLAEAVPYLRMRGRIGEQSEYIEDDEGGGGGDALSSSIGSTEFPSRRCQAARRRQSRQL